MGSWKKQKGKGGSKREMNPTDAYRKQQRNKEKKRNKQERKQVREDTHLLKNPDLIKEEIDKLNHQSIIAQLDQNGAKRRQKLENLLQIVKNKQQTDKYTKQAQLQGWTHQSYHGYEELYKKSGANTEEKVSEDSESSEYSESGDEGSVHTEGEEEKVGDIIGLPPLPVGLPPSLPPSAVGVHTPSIDLPTSTLGLHSPFPSFEEKKTQIPVDFSKITNPEKPILPPPPPPLPNVKLDTAPPLNTWNTQTDLQTLTWNNPPPLPQGLPPNKQLPFTQPQHKFTLPSHNIGINTPLQSNLHTPITHNLTPIHPSSSVHTLHTPRPLPQSAALPSPLPQLTISPPSHYTSHAQPPDTNNSTNTSFLPPILPFGAVSYIPGVSPPPLPSLYPPSNNIQQSQEAYSLSNTFTHSTTENPPTSLPYTSQQHQITHSNATPNKPPINTNNPLSAMFVPTQLRVRNKEISKPKTNKLSSINQVTAYSTGTHRTQNTPKNEQKNIITAKEFITNVSAKRKADTESQSHIDQAFNEFLRQVQKT